MSINKLPLFATLTIYSQLVHFHMLVYQGHLFLTHNAKFHVNNPCFKATMCGAHYQNYTDYYTSFGLGPLCASIP